MRWAASTIGSFVTCLGLSFAQVDSSLPSCGQTCVQNVTAAAISSGECRTSHSHCLCVYANFQQNVQACSETTCTQSSDLDVVNLWVDSFCQGVSIEGTGSPGPSSQPTSTLSTSTTTASTSQSSSQSSTQSSSQSSSQSSTQSSSSAFSLTKTISCISADAIIPTTSASAAVSSTPKSSSALSTSGKVGLAVGVTVMVFIIAAIGIALFVRSRGVQYSSGKNVSMIHEIDGAEIPSELPATRISEQVGSDSMRHETYSPIAPMAQREEYGYREQRVDMPDGWQANRFEPGPVSPLESTWGNIER